MCPRRLAQNVGQRVVRRSLSLLARAHSLTRGSFDQKRCPLVFPLGITAPWRDRPPENRKPRNSQVPGGTPASLTLHSPAVRTPALNIRFLSRIKRPSWTFSRSLASRRP